MSRRVVRTVAVLVMAVLTLLLVAVVVVDPPWAGPVVLVVTPGHGLHEGDLWAAAAWSLGAVVCGPVWALTRRGAVEAG